MTSNFTFLSDMTSPFVTTPTTQQIVQEEMRYPLWEAVLIIIACTFIIIGTIIGNVLVCLAVGIVKKLRTPSNLLIVSLAVADLLVAVADMPLAAMYEVTGVWKLGQTMCDVWTSLDVLLCTASILNLCMISIDRYLVITRPFDYAMKRTPALMALMIFSVWLLSALISIPPLFGWKADLPPLTCELSQAIGYQFYATIGAFYLPLCVMIFIYYRIFAVSLRIHKSELKSAPPEHRTLKSTSSFSSGNSSYKRPSHAAETKSANCTNRKQCRNSSIESSSSSRPCLHKKNSNQSQCTRNDSDLQQRSSTSPTTLTVPDSASIVPNQGQGRKSLKNVSFLSRPSSAGGLHKLPSASRERKTTKTLGIIMGCFVACWLPFFILALVRPFLTDPGIIPHWLASLLLWLGFANSFLNPIIYARFNRDFRKPFKEILFCRCRKINTHLRTDRFTEEYGTNANNEHSVPGVLRRNSQLPNNKGSFKLQDRHSGISHDGAKFF